MENPSKVFTGASRVPHSFDRPPQVSDDWRLALDARVNLLLIGNNGGVQDVLESLLLDLHEPVAAWSPGERLVPPPFARAGTMILHDVGALRHEDQVQLLGWLERPVGRTRVVSTTSAPLLPRVEAGAFIDTLYYRLNTVCVDVSA
jgi:hypothetical protein